MAEIPDTNDPEDAPKDVEVIEIVTGQVDSEGNTIVDDAVIVVDGDGTVLAEDEAITFKSPEGVIIRSERGEDGEMHLVDGDDA